MELLTGSLILSLAFVNGWTDAPNAIATAVTTRAMTPRTAVRMGAICNLLGLLLGYFFADRLLGTIVDLASGLTEWEATAVSAAAMGSAVLWAVVAWRFGIPTSESHGMLAGAIGGTVALRGATAFAHPTAGFAVTGLFFALILGGVLGFVCAKILYYACKKRSRVAVLPHIRQLQRCGAFAAACLHGMQDGQKFLGMFLLCGLADLPTTALLLVAVALTMGTSLGGYRILRRVGGLVTLSPEKGLCAECASVITILFATLMGLPVSTTHAKTAAILGSGAAGRRRRIRVGSVCMLFVSWLATFPICGGIAYFMVQCFFA